MFRCHSGVPRWRPHPSRCASFLPAPRRPDIFIGPQRAPPRGGTGESCKEIPCRAIPSCGTPANGIQEIRYARFHVDGDFTANELRRVAYGAFHEGEIPRVVPILLDMSGAAGVPEKSSEQLQAMGSIFGAYRDRIAGLAVVAPSTVHGIFKDDGDFGKEAGVALFACTAHGEARDWLANQG